MSCSSPIYSYTNSKYIYRGVSMFRQSYTCGRCASCISKNRTDWRVRSYYEAQNCLSHRGFVLFDTLTYCDDYIKRYSDIYPHLNIPNIMDKTCFSRDDVQKFFKRLRINLKRAGYSYKPEQLRYILTSEYGSDEKRDGFQLTHRPHYHLLFFVSFPITPIEFSRYVSRSWYLGKTDGVKPSDNCDDCPVKKYCKGFCLYQSPNYVINERIVNSDTPANTIKCVNYVTKYVSKDMYNSDILQQRVDMLWRYLNPEYKSDILLYRQYRQFCGQVLPFHLQSRYFGLSVLDDFAEKEYILKTNQIHLPTSDRNVVLSVSLPRYYQRHLYYNYKKTDGRVKWYLTEYGIDTKVSQMTNKIEQFMCDYRVYDDTLPDDELFQLSLYKNVYRGTLSDEYSLYLPWREYYRKMLIPHDDDEKPLYYNFNTKRDKLTVGSFLSTSYSITPDAEIIYKGKQLHKEFIPYEGYTLVNEKTCPFWYGFESKLVAFDRWKIGIAFARDAVQRVDDANLDYYRQLGLLQS